MMFINYYSVNECYSCCLYNYFDVHLVYLLYLINVLKCNFNTKVFDDVTCIVIQTFYLPFKVGINLITNWKFQLGTYMLLIQYAKCSEWQKPFNNIRMILIRIWNSQDRTDMFTTNKGTRWDDSNFHWLKITYLLSKACFRLPVRKSSSCKDRLYREYLKVPMSIWVV